MSKRRRIGIDCDDVLIDSMSGLIRYNNRMYGTSYRRQDFKSFDLESVWGCTLDIAIQRCQEFYFSEEHTKLTPVIGAVEVIEALTKTNDLVLVTGRPESIRDLTTEILQRHFQNLFMELHFVGHHSGNKYSKKTKGDVCKDLGVNIFIEDAPKHALSVSNEGIPVLLFDTPWNQGELPPNITRVFSWEEIETILQ